MTDRRFAFGIVATLAWLLVMATTLVLGGDSVKTLKPNEWGDFFAGFTAPLAFLWLVLGYLQQGQELKASGAALEEQAAELRRSVEQQAALVAVTREQVVAEREAAAESRRATEEALKPRFAIKSDGGSFVGNGHSTYNLAIANAGGTITEVVACFDETVLGTRTILDVPIFARGQQARTALALGRPFPDEGATLVVTYVDGLGRPGELHFAVTRIDPQNRESMLKFAQVGA